MPASGNHDRRPVKAKRPNKAIERDQQNAWYFIYESRKFEVQFAGRSSTPLATSAMSGKPLTSLLACYYYT